MEGGVRAESEDVNVRRVERPVIVRIDALARLVLIEEHVVGRELRRKVAAAHELCTHGRHDERAR